MTATPFVDREVSANNRQEFLMEWVARYGQVVMPGREALGRGFRPIPFDKLRERGE